MITRDQLRAIRNDLPVKVTILKHGPGGPISKEIEGYSRFQCPACQELRATVNPRNNLAHCFCCGHNWNNIDVFMALGWGFLPAVDVLKQWLRQHQEHRSSSQPGASRSNFNPNKDWFVESGDVEFNSFD